MNERWKAVYTTVRLTAWELRQIKDAVDHVINNPGPKLDYACLAASADKLANLIGDINYGRMVGEESL